MKGHGVPRSRPAKVERTGLTPRENQPDADLLAEELRQGAEGRRDPVRYVRQFRSGPKGGIELQGGPGPAALPEKTGVHADGHEGQHPGDDVMGEDPPDLGRIEHEERKQDDHEHQEAHEKGFAPIVGPESH